MYREVYRVARYLRYRVLGFQPGPARKAGPPRHPPALMDPALHAHGSTGRDRQQGRAGLGVKGL